MASFFFFSWWWRFYDISWIDVSSFLLWIFGMKYVNTPITVNESKESFISKWLLSEFFCLAYYFNYLLNSIRINRRPLHSGFPIEVLLCLHLRRSPIYRTSMKCRQPSPFCEENKYLKCITNSDKFSPIQKTFQTYLIAVG